MDQVRLVGRINPGSSVADNERLGFEQTSRFCDESLRRKTLPEKYSDNLPQKIREKKILFYETKLKGNKLEKWMKSIQAPLLRFKQSLRDHDL